MITVYHSVNVINENDIVLMLIGGLWWCKWFSERFNEKKDSWIIIAFRISISGPVFMKNILYQKHHKYNVKIKFEEDVLYNFVLCKIIQNISFYYNEINMLKVAYVNYSV